MGVDAEGDLARGVAELPRYERDVCPTSNEQAGKGVPKVMPPDRLEPSFLESGLQGSQTDVRRVVGSPYSCREHVVVGLVETCLPLVVPKRIRQRRHEDDVTHPALGLRRHVSSLSI